jgi:hypothetical protein
VSIIQPDQREDRLAAQRIASSEALAVDSAPLHPPGRTRGGSVATILWTLLLLLGILMLIARGPSDAPPFEQLTQYVCDPLPPLPVPGNRSQPYRLRLTCRAGDQLVYQRQGFNDGSNPNGSKACQREGGSTRIWRMAPPSAYGATVFHSTCGDHVVLLFKNRAAAYESTQRFIVTLACGLILLSLGGLTKKWFHRRRTIVHRAASIKDEEQ